MEKIRKALKSMGFVILLDQEPGITAIKNEIFLTVRDPFASPDINTDGEYYLSVSVLCTQNQLLNKKLGESVIVDCIEKESFF